MAPWDSLEAAWFLEEASGDPRSDSSGKGNTLSIEGVVPQSIGIAPLGNFGAGSFSTGPGRLFRSNVDLASPFPGKSGGNAPAFTIGGFVRINSLSQAARLFNKTLSLVLDVNQFSTIPPKWDLDCVLIDQDIETYTVQCKAPGGESIQTGVDYHVVMRWQGDTDSEFSGWLDGVKMPDTHIIPAPLNATTNELMLGARTSGFGNPLDGVLDEWFVYSRALSDAEIQFIASNGLFSFLTPTANLSTVGLSLIPQNHSVSVGVSVASMSTLDVQSSVYPFTAKSSGVLVVPLDYIVVGPPADKSLVLTGPTPPLPPSNVVINMDVAAISVETRQSFIGSHSVITANYAPLLVSPVPMSVLAEYGAGMGVEALNLDPSPLVVSSVFSAQIGVASIGLDAKKTRTQFLFRIFQLSDLTDIGNAGNSSAFGEFDGFSVHADPQPSTPAHNAMTIMMNEGKVGFKYLTVLDFPHSQLDGPWYTWLRDNVQFPLTGQPARYHNTGNDTIGLFIFFCALNEYTELINWNAITPTVRGFMLDRLEEIVPSGMGYFMDQAWLQPATWMFCETTGACGPCQNAPAQGPQAGALYTDFTAQYPGHKASILAFYQEEAARSQANGIYSIKNGEHGIVGGDSIPRPIFLENSQTGSSPYLDQTNVDYWREHSKNILSIDLPAFPNPLGNSFNALKTLWLAEGGWVCMIGATGASDPNEQAAYADLVAARAAVEA